MYELCGYDYLWDLNNEVITLIKNKHFRFFSKQWGQPTASKAFGNYKSVINSDEINLINYQCKEMLNFFTIINFSKNTVFFQN